MSAPLLYTEDVAPVFDVVPSTQELLRTKEIPWDIYMTARLISDHELQLLRRYDKRDPEQRARLLLEGGPLYVAALLSVLKNVSKDETVQYVLALLDDMVQSDSSAATLFHKLSHSSEDSNGTQPNDPFNILLKLLHRTDWFTEEKAAIVLAAVIDSRDGKESLGKALAEGGAQRDPVARTISSFLDWTISQLRRPRHPTRAVPIAVHCLSVLLREAPVRSLFYRAGGIPLLAPLIGMPASGIQLNIQLLYESIVCVWQLSFYKPAADSLATTTVVGGLVDVVRLAQKEKLVRIALLALRNLLTDGTHTALEFAVVEKGLPKALATRQEQPWDDNDIPTLLDWLSNHLDQGVLAMTSLERYKQEVLQGTLTRSPLHESESFWLENAERLMDGNCVLLRALLKVLEISKDSTSLMVACKDLAQFVTYYPHGKVSVQYACTIFLSSFEIDGYRAAKEHKGASPGVQKFFYISLALLTTLCRSWCYS